MLLCVHLFSDSFYENFYDCLQFLELSASSEIDAFADSGVQLAKDDFGSVYAIQRLQRFLQRGSIACYAERCISHRILSVRLTVCHSPVLCQNDSS